MELGVDDYVTKPFDPLDLVARVNVLLARRADADAEAATEVGPDTAGIPGGGVVAEGAPEGNGSGPGVSPAGPAPGAEAPPVPDDTDRGDRSPL
jgi:hypothetical protein